LGVEKSPLQEIGGELEDGSVILTDLSSLESSQPKPFSVAVNGHQFSGAYVGVFALKAAADGRILKLACGGLRVALARRSRNPPPRHGHRCPAQPQRRREAYEAVLLGQPASNSLKLLP